MAVNPRLGELRSILETNRLDYDPKVGSFMATGSCAREAVATAMSRDKRIAIDTETPGTNDPFTIKCLTASWIGPDGMVTVLLDPLRNGEDHNMARRMIRDADELILQNAAFDVPGLVAAGLLTLDGIDKVVDTLVYARMAWPDTFVPKTLAALSSRLLGADELAGGMALAFKAAGFRSQEQGYREMDIDYPIYRFGAMADTAMTLRVLEPVRNAAIDRCLDHPFTTYGCTDRTQAAALAEREQIVNRVMLRRSAVGLAVDFDYLDRYRTEVDTEVLRAEQDLRQGGIEPGATAGIQLVTRLFESGELPQPWPRTPKGKLKSDKVNLDTLDHPLAHAVRRVASASKIVGYLDAVVARSIITGRLHPQVGVLAASTTGRMSYNDPALQQFPAEARPIITDDGQGLTSVDWSQIEPVILANMAGDETFLAPFEAGADLYEPIQRAAGIERKVAKIVLLATMYGQGEAALAGTIKHTRESSAQIKRQMLAAMPETAKFMGKINQIGNNYGIVPTMSGRILTLPEFNGEYAAYKATNFLTQGSAYDILSETIVECKRQGLSDHIQLALHDEIVCDTDAAEAVREIMLTPPPALITWAKRTPILRTDLAHMGHSWASV